MSAEKRPPTTKDIAVLLLGRSFARASDELFEPLELNGKEVNPYAGLSDVDKTTVLVESAMIILGQVGGMAVATAEPSKQAPIVEHLCVSLRKRIEECRLHFLEMQEDKAKK